MFRVVITERTAARFAHNLLSNLNVAIPKAICSFLISRLELLKLLMWFVKKRPPTVDNGSSEHTIMVLLLFGVVALVCLSISRDNLLYHFYMAN